MLKMTEYLGDGAYVRWESDRLCIYTYNGIEESNHVYLEHEEIDALNRFLKAVQVARASSPREEQ